MSIQFPPRRSFRSQFLAALVSLSAPIAPVASADPLFAAVAWQTSREAGGLSQQPPGGIVSLDLSLLGAPTLPSGSSASPGGTLLVADVFDAPAPADPDEGHLNGLEAVDGQLFAASFACSDEFCSEGPSRLLRIDPTTGIATDIGPIREGTTDLSIYDLARQPGTNALYGISTFFGSSCFGCLYTIDLATAEATRVGVVPLGQGAPAGLAFLPDGTLLMTTSFPIAGLGTFNNRNPLDLVTLDPTNGTILVREDLLLEQQFNVVGGGTTFLIRSTVLGGLMATADGRLVGAGDNGNTVVYERVLGQVRAPNGTPIGSARPVWRVLGDSGENLGDLVEVPEPGVATGLAAVAWVVAARRRSAFPRLDPSPPA